MRMLRLAMLSLLLLAAARAQATPVSFSEQIQPLLDAKVAALIAEPGLDLSSWDGLVAGSEVGQVVVPFSAKHSLLYQVTEDQAAITDAERALLRDWIDDGARSDEGVVPYADAEHRLYVGNQAEASVSIIDMDRNVLMRVVDLQALGFSENAKPHHTAVEPDGAHWYVSLIGESKVLKFDRDHNLVGQVDFETPGMLAMDPTADRLYVARSMMAVNPPRRVGVIERSSMGLEEVDVFFARPHALVVNPVQGYAYTASLTENRLASLPLGEEDIEALTRLEGTLHTLVQFAVSPDGQTLVAGGQMTGDFLIFDLADPGNPELVATLDLGAMPWHPTFTPDGRFVYVGNQAANTISVIDMETRTLAHTISGEGLAEPHGIASSPDGRFVYVSNRNLKSTYLPRSHRLMHGEGGHAMMDKPEDATEEQTMDHSGHGAMDHAAMMSMVPDLNGTVVVIDTATQEIVRVIEVGAYPSGMSAEL